MPGAVQQLWQRVHQTLAAKYTLLCNVVDFSKAFDSVHWATAWRALESQGMPRQIVEVIKRLYDTSTVAVRLSAEGLMSPTFRQVRRPHVPNIPTGQRASCSQHSDRSEGLMSPTFRQVRGPHVPNIPTGQRASCPQHSDRSEGLLSPTFRQVRGPHVPNIPTGQRREARLFI